MTAVIECAGAPRDLGLDQGRGCRGAVRAALAEQPRARWLRALPGLARRDPRAAHLDREIRRHFPQLSERIDGLARGADVRRAALLRRLVEMLGGGVGVEAAIAARTVTGALLARSAAAGHVIRRSSPEVGFRSLELTPPWLVSALAGVNEAGLAAAAVAVAFAPPRDAGPAPALLLVQECLQRFSSVDSARDWCGRRPADEGFALLFADADGELAALGTGGSAPGTPDALAVAAGERPRREQIEKACREAASLDARALARILAEAPLAPSPGAALLDPRGRRLAVAADADDSVAAEPAWLCV